MPGGLGQPARSAGESANTQKATVRIKKPQHRGERLIEVRVFIVWLDLSLSLPLDGANCPPVRAGPRIIRNAMRSAKERSYSFWLNPGPVYLGSRTAARPTCDRCTDFSVWPTMGWSTARRDRPFPIRSGVDTSSLKTSHYCSTVQKVLEERQYSNNSRCVSPRVNRDLFFAG